MDERYALLLDWLRSLLAVDHIAPASSDASFRRYYRIYHNGTTYIGMDSPPATENAGKFLTVAAALRDLGLHTPVVLNANLEQGFLLLSDLGTRQYLTELNASNVGTLYGDALDALLRLQTSGDPATTLLPAYDAELLQREMELFRTWFLGQQCGLRLEPAAHAVLDTVFARLRENALAQPRVWVHRDYHSRNLMVTAQNNPGVLDFQDAVVGPITYDLVSLLRDCYIAWPREQVEQWVLHYWGRLRALNFAGLPDATGFLRWFDLMGVQRHLKAIGIFARLNIRDGKPGYLGDIPRTLGYVMEVAARYPELAGLHHFLQKQELIPTSVVS